jgi:ribulose-5-phosphate 4-epimerase/fuculose-1-phosphate aldolase
MANITPLTQLEQELKAQVALSCRVIGNNQGNVGTRGHVSVRLPGTDIVLIKGRGPDVEGMEYSTVQDVISINLKGELIEAREGLTPPAETAMHLAVYRQREEVQSVIHSHPDWIVLLTITNKPIVPVVNGYDGGSSTRMINAGIPVYPRSLTITSDALGEDMMKTMGSSPVCFLAGHGVCVAGNSVENATQTSLTIYETARLVCMAYQMGGPVPVSERDTEEYASRRQQNGQQAPAQPRMSTIASSSFWRYYQKKMGDLPA